MREHELSTALLGWYDAHARVMPWRVAPADKLRGVRPNPYHVWLSEVMLQQTTVAAVTAYFTKFTQLWPQLTDLALAEDADVMAAWAGLGYYARARNLLKCARVVAKEHGGVFPTTYDALIALPGIGPYTAAAIASIAFDRPETVLDGNVERVMARLHNDPTPLPKAKPVFTDYATALTPKQRPGDYAQAVMDLGATICTPRNPACTKCPWQTPCKAWQSGTQAELPQKTPKKAKPIRVGTVFIGRREDGAWLLETRPETGLLGGMLGWPGNAWTVEPQTKADPPCAGQWREIDADVRHTFTHFHLVLRVQIADLPLHTTPATGAFIAASEFTPSSLPTVMKKAFSLARGAYSP